MPISRMTPERLAWIRAELGANKIIAHTAAAELLAELDAVMEERDAANRDAQIAAEEVDMAYYHIAELGDH